MRFVANYEIESDASVVSDDLRLKVKDPNDQFFALIKNVPRRDRSSPFTIELHIYFDAAGLNEAKDVARTRLMDCLNLLVLASGAGLSRPRIKRIVDATPSKTIRDCLLWVDEDRHRDPQPTLDRPLVSTVERLLNHDPGPAIRRALRWYRIAVHSPAPEDQFQCFWFALEILAEHHKTSEKVPDRCPRCRTPLYCETCDDHPSHRPYAKQAIFALVEKIEGKSGTETFRELDKTRNGLMHGATLSEIQQDAATADAPQVDRLGKLVHRALLHEFRSELSDEGAVIGMPSTFLHHEASIYAHVQTVVPTDGDGYLDLSFSGMSMTIHPELPPQSGRPTIVPLTSEQFKRLSTLANQPSEYQDLLRRLSELVEQREEQLLAVILATDVPLIRAVVAGRGKDEASALLQEILPAE